MQWQNDRNNAIAISDVIDDEKNDDDDDNDDSNSTGNSNNDSDIDSDRDNENEDDRDSKRLLLKNDSPYAQWIPSYIVEQGKNAGGKENNFWPHQNIHSFSFLSFFPFLL